MSALGQKETKCIAATNHPSAMKSVSRLRHALRIAASESASKFGCMVRSSVLAVLRLAKKSNLVGCSIGKSQGLAPPRLGRALERVEAALTYREKRW